MEFDIGPAASVMGASIVSDGSVGFVDNTGHRFQDEALLSRHRRSVVDTNQLWGVVPNTEVSFKIDPWQLA